MPKLNRGYTSFIEYVKYKLGYPCKEYGPSSQFNPSQYAYLYDFEDPRSKYEKWDHIRGAFQPLADMWKDAKDTFKPYKSSYHVKRDAMQPLRGIGNIGVAILSFVGGIILFFLNTLRYACTPSTFCENMSLGIARLCAWLIDSVTTGVRGAFQIATTPLTWFIRMPLRGIITAVTGMPKIEDNKGIQRLVRKGYEVAKCNENGSGVSMDFITRALHVKYKKACLKGQATAITRENEASCYHHEFRTDDGLYYTATYGRGYIPEKMPEDKLNDARRYLGLFGSNPEAAQVAVGESAPLLRAPG